MLSDAVRQACWQQDRKVPLATDTSYGPVAFGLVLTDSRFGEGSPLLYLFMPFAKGAPNSQATCNRCALLHAMPADRWTERESGRVRGEEPLSRPGQLFISSGRVADLFGFSMVQSNWQLIKIISCWPTRTMDSLARHILA